jgi:Ca-activated chloride channel homolog
MQKILALVEIFIPRPRQKFKLTLFVPLFLFVLIFLTSYLSFTLTGKVVFSRPSAFFLLFFCPWIWWMGSQGFSGLSPFRNASAQVCRLCLAGLFIMLLAKPQTQRENKTLTVMYAVDLSDSIGSEMRDASLEFMAETVAARPGTDEAGLLAFGSDAAVELPPRKSFAFERIQTTLAKDGTNLEKALSLASAMIPEENNGRIVLISDGTSTAGNIDKVLDELKSRKIAVDVLPIDFDYKHEVWLEKLQLPANVKIGETYETNVILSSLKKGVGKLSLFENDTLLYEEDITFKAGKNRYALPMKLRNAGYYEYRALVKVPKGKDGWKENNVAINSLYLQGKGKVLLVIDPEGDERDYKLLTEAILKSQREVVIKDAFEVPRDSLKLLPYDCIILVNVPRYQLDSMQIKACHDAVYNQGTGLFMIGGANSFGAGGYHKTLIEKALPINMDITNRKIMPKGALVVILHTCEFENGNTWAKRIAKASIKVLSSRDEAGLLAWDSNGGDTWIFPIMPVSKYPEMIKKINNASPDDMMSFVGTMKMALAGLKSSNASQKHVIIISDGDPAPPSPALLKQFVNAKISVTTVLVDGYHGAQFVQPMRLIANSTKGRFYHPKNPKSLPSIFIKEAQTLKKSMIQEKTFYPKVEFDDGSLLKGIDSLPKLYGYVLTSVKGDPGRCRVILRGPDKEQLDPILAIGNYGIGKSAAFTSDLSPRWGRDWLNWDKAVPFIKQTIVSISRVSQEGSLRMNTYYSGSNATILVEDFHSNEEFLEIVARVAGPGGRSVDVSLKQIAPRRYQGRLQLWAKGNYQIVAVANGVTRSEKTVGGLVLPYSAEYLKFSSNMKDLEKIASKTGGRILKRKTDGKEIFTAERQIRKSSKPFFDTLLLILACLIPLDVALRRVQIDWLLLKGMFVRKKVTDSTATMGALLSQKKMRQAEGQETKVVAQSIYKPVVMETPKTTLKTPAVENSNTEKKEDEAVPEGSTTSRLLAMKKKRDK